MRKILGASSAQLACASECCPFPLGLSLVPTSLNPTERKGQLSTDRKRSRRESDTLRVFH